MKSTPVIDPDTDNLLGYVVKEPSGWSATTIFGYVITRTTRYADSEAVLLESGEKVLKDLWRYYDSDDHDWFSCKLKEVYENRVTIVRTNELGFEDRNLYKLVTIKNPTEATLQLA